MPIDPISILISILKVIVSPLTTFGKWLFEKLRFQSFKLKQRSSWIDEETALKSAQLTLGGSVKKVIPFNNYKSKRKYIAALRTKSDSDHRLCVYLLEKIGGSYNILWTFDEFGIDEESFKVEDVKKQGVKAITFISESWGSGYGERHLYIYATDSNELSKVKEEYNYSSAGSIDYIPKIENVNDEEYREKIINFASKRGFLSEVELPDFTDPKYAVHRWHKENGDYVLGKIKIYRYDGEPNYGSSIMDIAEDDNIRWIAHFKGPLFRYNKEHNNHYIVYSPKNVYDWAKSILGTKKDLFFICHFSSGLFLYKSESQELTRFCGYANKQIPSADKIVVEDKSLKFLDWNELPIFIITNLNELMPCWEWCRNQNEHLPDKCSDKTPEDEYLQSLEKIKETSS